MAAAEESKCCVCDAPTSTFVRVCQAEGEPRCWQVACSAECLLVDLRTPSHDPGRLFFGAWQPMPRAA
jgi:hypothetical protein